MGSNENVTCKGRRSIFFLNSFECLQRKALYFCSRSCVPRLLCRLHPLVECNLSYDFYLIQSILCHLHWFHKMKWKRSPVTSTQSRKISSSTYYILSSVYTFPQLSLFAFLSYQRSLTTENVSPRCFRYCGRVIWAQDLKLSDPKFKSHFDHQLDLFQVVPGSTA